jgi:hypothetical protein
MGITMPSLTENSTSLIVAENSLATPIAIPTPSDANFPASQLSVTVTALPSNGTVLLAVGTTTVSVGESLTVAQLTGLEFEPTPNISGQSSDFAFTVSDPGGNTGSATATLAIASGNTPSAATATPLTASNGDTPGDTNSVLGMALNIGIPSEAPPLA